MCFVYLFIVNWCRDIRFASLIYFIVLHRTIPIKKREVGLVVVTLYMYMTNWSIRGRPKRVFMLLMYRLLVGNILVR